jgi:hypothetical protein
VSGLRLYRASDMERSRPVVWRLGPGYLPAGKVSLLVGDEGIGKSLWTIRALACISTGHTWGPFETHSDPAPAILIATEDGFTDTIRPRLEVVEADLNNIHMLYRESDGSGPPSCPEDLDLLWDSPLCPALVVVDAWVDTVRSGLQLKEPQKARNAIAPWKKYAAETNAAVLLVTHTNRGDRDNLRNTYGLSGALRQVARSSLYAAEDTETGDLLVGPEKGNLGELGVAQRFRREAVPYFPPTEHCDGTVARLEFLGTCERPITEILSARGRSLKASERKTDAIDAWLTGVLSDSSMEADHLYLLGGQAGFTRDQVKRSRLRLGVRAIKSGDTWIAELPQVQERKGAEETSESGGYVPPLSAPNVRSVKSEEQVDSAAQCNWQPCANAITPHSGYFCDYHMKVAEAGSASS